MRKYYQVATQVSIHAPARGATWIDRYVRTILGVSIHAPARGATVGPLTALGKAIWEANIENLLFPILQI